MAGNAGSNVYVAISINANNLGEKTNCIDQLLGALVKQAEGRRMEKVLRVHMPCGWHYDFEDEFDLRRKLMLGGDIPCPCGSPVHWVAKQFAVAVEK